ncbi:MAG: substrate-binding domain-containing protein [Actinobacteria bacterium]|nr:substrate-binding domain-containing protein [Actinomycetota bacterium]MBV8396708.1 substrate-binding domain-containing protein [Actinomycetota bacterium]MBV8598215.1 substrate-binding domain-containing protein [Actinomycetota bacterium]
MKYVSRKALAFGLTGLAIAGLVATTATASSSKRTASAQVCVLLPDTKSSVRWVQFDAPDFAKALKAAGVTYMINNALNDPQKQLAQAQACLAAGAKVVVETALDNGSAAAIEKLFTSKGGKAIDYDRQVSGGSASVYVTFDGKAVGEAQANGIIAALKASGKYTKKPVVAELWGGQTDQNAFWFKSGNDAVLNPLFSNGTLSKGPQQFVPGWLATNAGPIFAQMLVKTNNKIDAAIAANDNIAGAVIAQEKAKHLSPIPLSGQDATPQGIQYILAGWQTGTVYKYVPDEAAAAAAAAVALLKGQTPKSNGYRMNGSKKEPTYALPVIWITKANYTRLFTDGFLKKSDVCVGDYAKYC